MKAKLAVVTGKPVGMQIPLLKRFLIGRGTDCNLRPRSNFVSRHHCLITMPAGNVRVRDLESTHGTLINGQRIVGEVTVQDGDLLQVGPLVFRFMGS